MTERLCYVDGCFAWFTTRNLSEQWGDDWNDAPYEHNAGTPYGPSVRHYADGSSRKLESDWNDDGSPKWTLIKVAFDGPFETPAGIAGGNSIYSVEMINLGAVPWLLSRWGEEIVAIHAGCSLGEFKDSVLRAGGSVYEAAA